MAAASSGSSFPLGVMPVLCKFFTGWSVTSLEQGGEVQHQAEKSEFAPLHTYSTAKDSLTSSASVSTELLCPPPSLSLREHLLLSRRPPALPFSKPGHVEPVKLRAVRRVPLDTHPRVSHVGAEGPGQHSGSFIQRLERFSETDFGKCNTVL